jgi:hypothetical protein
VQTVKVQVYEEGSHEESVWGMTGSHGCRLATPLGGTEEDHSPNVVHPFSQVSSRVDIDVYPQATQASSPPIPQLTLPFLLIYRNCHLPRFEAGIDRANTGLGLALRSTMIEPTHSLGRSYCLTAFS